MGDSTFMRLALLASFLVMVSLSMVWRGSLGGRRFSGGHAWLVGGEEDAGKGLGERTNWDQGTFVSIPYAKCNLP